MGLIVTKALLSQSQVRGLECFRDSTGTVFWGLRGRRLKYLEDSEAQDEH